MSKVLRSGSYLKSRLVEVASEAALEASEPLARWAARKIRLEGKPFTFDGHEYLRGIYDDTSPHVVVIKAAQIGGTTWAILRSVRACLDGLNVIYFFPTRTDVVEFSKAGPATTTKRRRFSWRGGGFRSRSGCRTYCPRSARPSTVFRNPRLRPADRRVPTKPPAGTPNSPLVSVISPAV